MQHSSLDRREIVDRVIGTATPNELHVIARCDRLAVRLYYKLARIERDNGIREGLESGLTHAEVAERYGVSRPLVGHVIHQRHDPPRPIVRNVVRRSN